LRKQVLLPSSAIFKVWIGDDRATHRRSLLIDLDGDQFGDFGQVFQ
jgi:hypothetical protein